MDKLLWISLALGLSACAETSVEPAPEEGSDAPVETRRQTLLDQGEPNWMLAGGPGLVELVGGTDGEPDELTGRFVLESNPIHAAASGDGEWVVAGTGVTQPLDDEAVRRLEARTALSGDAIEFIHPAPTGYLIGGDNGRLQLLDSAGEPTNSEITVLSGSTVRDAAFNGTTWIAVGDNGDVSLINTPLSASGHQERAADGGAPIVAAAADPSNADTDPRFMVFSADSAITVGNTGIPGTPSQIEAGLQITTARFADGNVWIGTSDGRVGVATYEPDPTFSFTDVFSGAAVTEIVTDGTDFVALGANGQARLLDGTGATAGAAVQISSDPNRALVGAHRVAGGWLLIVGEIGFVAMVDDQLQPPRELTPLLDGATIRDASAGVNQVLLVGDGGAYQVVDELGNTVTTPQTAAGGADLHATSWNGEAWLVAGANGAAQIVDDAGNAMGNPSTLLDGETIRFAAWSGEFWLIGGDAGTYQLVRTDGTASGAARVLDGADTLWDARWSGNEWLMVGETGDATGISALVVSDPNVDPTPQTHAETGALYAIDFNGIEWLSAGEGGLIQRLSAQGMAVDDPIDVLTGFDIRDVYYNGLTYIIAGEFGSVRRLGQDYVPLRPPISVLDRSDAAVVLWTLPRGHALGPCLTDELCYAGPCVGGLTAGRCCDRACDRPCESCFQDDTGEADGTCAPVVAGKMPPVNATGPSDPCPRESESTCGLTGLCDGAGECEFYGGEVQCADSVCSLGQFTPAGVCDGAGQCGMGDEIDCAPYTGCTVDGCIDSCTSDEDCIDGYECDGSACVEAPEGMEPDDTTPPDDGGDDDGGCCATVRSDPSDALWLLVALLVLGLRRKSFED